MEASKWRGNDIASLRMNYIVVCAFLGAATVSAEVKTDPAAVPGYSTDVRSAVEDILSYKPQVRISTAGVKEIDLGRRLFFDPRLSRTNTVSCATCHQPALFGTDGLPRSKGVNCKEGQRNTLSLFTAGYYLRLGWDGRSESFEQSALRAIEGSKEMDQPLESLPAKLMSVPEYSKAFVELYGPDSNRPGNILKALAAYVSTLQAPEDSPFDQFIKNGKPLSESAQRGLVVYAGKGGCRNCHSSLTFTDNRFRNIGVTPTTPPDSGRYAIDPHSENWGAFRTPTLRNVSLTAPYMHDGSIATLREVIDFYDRAGPGRNRDADLRQGLGLTAQEKEDLLEFLKSLTSSVRAGKRSVPPCVDAGSADDLGDGNGRRIATETTSAPVPAALTAEAGALLTTASVLESELDALRVSIGRGRRVAGSKWSSVTDGLYADPVRAKDYCLKSPLTLRAISNTDLKMYQACKALEADDWGLCRQSHRSLNDKDDCITLFWNMKFSRSLMKGDTNAMAVCRQWMAFESYNIDAAVLEASCEGLQGTAAVEPLCRSLTERFPRGFPNLPACMTALGAVKGEDCSHYPGLTYRGALCQSIAAYREAFRAGAVSRCDDRYICRLLMGEAGACDAEMNRWKSRECGAVGRAPTGASPRAEPRYGLWSLMESVVLRAGDLILDPNERTAVDRLHGILLGNSPMATERAAADVFLVDSGQLSETLIRLEALSQEAGPNRTDWKAFRDKTARLRKSLRGAEEWFRESGWSASLARDRTQTPELSTPETAQTVIGKAGIQWVRIPAGTFTMGAGDQPNGQPHQVRVKSFQMAKTLVTNKQYKACVEARACTAAQDYGATYDGDDQPVVGVNWNQAEAFAKWVGGSLPSEAQWEYAARSAGKDWKYPWGNADATCGNAVISGCGHNATAPVCSKPAGNTQQGLCDMAGNTWEWAKDWYHNSYSGAPSDGSAWENPTSSYRVLRGGSWGDDAKRARSSDRNYDDPGNHDSDNYNVGFRLAR